ncbi:unnamed protein product [Ranitomeya imitator]|uniref:Uncharacterized protein n=1 Tax=Ranitomeya imitator TaxID=111125 RepID=A0ABN9LIV4_9NEOB|nr:unnamed protein product [Ranitomeya imitator]
MYENWCTELYKVRDFFARDGCVSTVRMLRLMERKPAPPKAPPPSEPRDRKPSRQIFGTETAGLCRKRRGSGGREDVPQKQSGVHPACSNERETALLCAVTRIEEIFAPGESYNIPAPPI